ncbi:MAG: flavin reductase [Clostridia bacterium]|nr:flavin reductase [Clostridia bacterium]
MANIDKTALFKIGYGLYAVTSNDGTKDNALIVNTVIQITDTPLRISVTINKNNYSCEVIERTKKLNICCLSESTPFEVFERLGFHSGRDTDKLKDMHIWYGKNGLPLLSCEYMNAFFSLDVIQTVDFGSHIMFVCDVTEAMSCTDEPSMTYSYYHANVKPKPNAKKKGFVCKVCGYVHEGDSLPPDFICPWCKHGADFFEEIN